MYCGNVFILTNL